MTDEKKSCKNAIYWKDNSGVSICMVGTPESTLFFEREAMLARRSLGLSYTMMEYNDEFCEFCKTLLKYCYVQNAPTIDEAMLMWLFNHSNGNASVVVSLIHDAQEIAIMEGLEVLDISTLNIAFEKRMTMLHDFITPPVMKASYPKKKKEILPDVKEETLVSDICIHQIAMRAKELNNNIITALKDNGINILEVSI